MYRSFWALLLSTVLLAGCEAGSSTSDDGAGETAAGTGSEDLAPPTIDFQDSDDTVAGQAATENEEEQTEIDFSEDEAAVQGQGDQTAVEPEDEQSVEEQLMTRLQELFAEQKYDEAIALLDDHLKQPDVNPNWTIQAMLLARQIADMKVSDADVDAEVRFRTKAGDYARQIIASGQSLPEQLKDYVGSTLLGYAAVLTQSGDIEGAKEAIDEALKMGLSDFSAFEEGELAELLSQDSSLAERIEAARAKALAAQVDEVKQLMAEFTTFDFDFELPVVNGESLKLADLAGKVVVADIWGTWCPPCREEIPHFIGLQKQFADDGLQIVGINYESEEPEVAEGKIAAFIEENGMNYPCVIGTDEVRDQVPDFRGYPTTLFIDRAGKVRLTMIGLQPQLRLEAVIKTLLDEPVPGSLN